MKSLSVRLGVIFLFIGLTIFTYAEGWGTDWKFIDMFFTRKFFYDTESIAHPSKNIVRVWVKTIYSEEATNFRLKQWGKNTRIWITPYV